MTGGTKGIHKDHIVFTSNRTHGLGIKNEVGVLLDTIGDSPGCLHGGGGNQGQTGSTFAVVFLGKGMLEKSIKLLLEPIQFPGTIKGGIEAEERNNHVGL